MDFAISLETDKRININDIPINRKGFKCNCICEECRTIVIACLKNDKKRKHFRHRYGIDEKNCKKTQEEKKKLKAEHHARQSPETAPTCIKKYKSLIEIWNEVQAPFIAKCKTNNCFYGIHKKPFENIYNKCYGFISDNVESVRNKRKYDSFKKSREIFGASQSIWEFFQRF